MWGKLDLVLMGGAMLSKSCNFLFSGYMTLIDIPYGWTDIRGNDPTPGPIKEVGQEANHMANTPNGQC